MQSQLLLGAGFTAAAAEAAVTKFSASTTHDADIEFHIASQANIATNSSQVGIFVSNKQNESDMFISM